jgi:U3 small nucleolar RNA-associated protein MPP10
LATLTQSAPPQTRSRTRSNSSTRKRDSSPPRKLQKTIDVRETPLPTLLIEGMNTDQIWQQLDLRAARICTNLRVLQGDDEDGDGNLDGENSDDDESEDADEDEGEVEVESEDEDEDEDAQMDIDDENLWEELSDGEEDEGSATDGVADLQEDTSEDEEDDGPPTSMLDVIHNQRKQNTSKSHSQVPLDLDDGFFDLASFNAEAEQMEVTKRKLNFVTDEDSTEESDVDIFGSVDDLTIEGMDDGLGEYAHMLVVVLIPSSNDRHILRRLFRTAAGNAKQKCQVIKSSVP